MWATRKPKLALPPNARLAYDGLQIEVNNDGEAHGLA